MSHEFGYKGEVWQRGFSEVQVLGDQAFKAHRKYISENPLKAGLIRAGESFPFCYQTLAEQKLQGLKPTHSVGAFMRHD
jgi:putative transposase